nr:Holliday junction resolvase RuvX [Candidatus Gracilibacteria bacterium]
MSAIAIDLGEKKVGIAVEINNIAFPKKIVSRIDLVRELREFFKLNLNYDTIIVGLPYDLFGKDDKQLNKTTKFIDKLKEIFPKKNIIGVDERYTTFEAQNINNTFLNKKDKVDDISACLILESYLQRVKNK